ncbi:MULTISPECIES: hypothetical protein [unclassified Chryseobacterium]|uniref:hypothetical protein n=1 Tax=unclassified Chryseobacterium TaxID=2593645 RepID=UPI0009E8B9C7|nr:MULTISPECIES: hypothetical protein [unclassified Chryseobacterium]
MKKSFNILMICAAQLAFAQIAIGKSSITALPSPAAPNTPNPSISLEFGEYAGPQLGKGIILPYVNSASAVVNSVEGTFFYDVSDKIVKLKNGTNSYFALSKNETAPVGTNPAFDTTGVVSTALQDAPNVNELPNAKVNIGSSNSGTPPGILVLENANQAMILPKVTSPHLNIINPEPGMMAYDTVTKQLAVYNGKVWSFWKP